MPEDSNVILDNRHWSVEEFSQRLTKNQWKKVLLNYDDKIIFKGELRKLVAEYLGAGVYEIYKLKK